MTRNRIPALGPAFLMLLLSAAVSCAERDLEPLGEDPVGATAAPLVEVLRLEEVRSVEVSLFPRGGIQVSGAFCRHTTPFPWADRLGGTGPCRLLHWRPVEGFAPVELDTGTVTVELAGSTFELTAPDDALPCFRAPTGPLPELRAGDEVRVRSTGGRDVPAFELRLAVPDGSSIAGPDAGRLLVVGEPWDVAWTGADEDSFVEVASRLDGTDLVMSCRGIAGSSFAVPGESTAAWPAALDKARLRVGVERIVDSGGDRPVKLFVRRLDATGMAAAAIGAP